MRCFTVLLTCGWLLFTAPLDPNGKVRANLPLSDWKHEKSFDTAKECEAERESASKIFQAMLQWAKNENKPVTEHPGYSVYTPLALSRCIPSDSIKWMVQ
jgi:hypothetical protein